MKDKSRAKGKRTSKYTEESIRVLTPSNYGWRVLGKLVQDLDYLLTESEKTSINQIIRNKDYLAYLALSEEWGPQCKTLSDVSLPVMRAKYQIVALLKKFQFPSDAKERRTSALKKFLDAEEACKLYNQGGYMALAAMGDPRLVNVFTYAIGFLRKLLGDFVPNEKLMTHWSRHGPGSNLDTKKGHNSVYFKYMEWPYSCTKGAARRAKLAIQSDERWIGALEDSYRERYEIPKHAILDQEVFWSRVFTIVDANKIAFVPKNALTDRSIAIEPSMNLYLQLGVDGYIRRRLKRWGVDIDDQKKNQELARIGSRDWEDPDNFVTLDLAAASDSISVKLCRLLLPIEWYDLLMELRTPYGVVNGEKLCFQKISSMGNGFTFALETAIFTSIVFGVMKEFQGAYRPDQCAIYGDDIIVPKSISGQTIDMLNRCGFRINSDKSFIEGPFRESCGADWFKGQPVRPVFLTSPPSSVLDLWCDINRIRRILSLRFMVEESNCATDLERWIPDICRVFTGPRSDEQFDSYLHVPHPMNYRYEAWTWKYRRLTIQPKPVRGESFLFRKLMHDLRERPIEHLSFLPERRRNSFDVQRTSCGSRFTVTIRNGVTVGATVSAASYWQSEYTES